MFNEEYLAHLNVMQAASRTGYSEAPPKSASET
ncbi:hypothetical protein C1S70_19565 [Azospirillum argentinense]|uniref:Uncharacterized protein n=1 Tax=Azospirillum argentinense TaxID=2970906 RepID=A0A2K1FXR9_9PROT|nr:hypothetical protein C1S70_19565 [Azospirillum argentinense]